MTVSADILTYIERACNDTGRVVSLCRDEFEVGHSETADKIARVWQLLDDLVKEMKNITENQMTTDQLYEVPDEVYNQAVDYMIFVQEKCGYIYKWSIFQADGEWWIRVVLINKEYAITLASANRIVSGVTV